MNSKISHTHLIQHISGQTSCGTIRVPSGVPKRKTSAFSRCLSFWVPQAGSPLNPSVIQMLGRNEFRLRPKVLAFVQNTCTVQMRLQPEGRIFRAIDTQIDLAFHAGATLALLRRFLIPDGGERVDTVSELCYIVCTDTESEYMQEDSRNRHFWTLNKESCYEGKRVFYQRDHPGKSG